MDILKLDFGGNFMKALVAKIIRKTIRKSCGLDIDILLDRMSVTAEDGRVHIHAEIDAETSYEDLADFIKSKDLL